MQNSHRKWYNGINTNAFRYCGEYYDSETATIYLRARHYNPSNGRFTQRDSFAGKQGDPLSLNLYTYCGNNPIIYIDFSGNDYYYYYGDDQERAANINIAELERKGETVHSYHIKSEKLFTKNWNLMETSKNDSIIINLHGNAEGVSYINISNLNNKHIGSLYLLSCNAGHQDNPNNPATQMFDEFDINRLVAADGTHFRDPEETTKKFLFFKWKSEIVSLSVEGDDAFNSARETYSPGSTRDSMGYVLYRREGREGNVVVESIGSKFKGISKLIKKAENS